ncbi:MULTISPECIES: Ref family recombination enhancement nuclease [unclassified Pantoea]|uniref:Ref family recombination enhancement nuclease n=1 Tax=unclassified Pantoea TaxID=2630326 RepID=UPI00205AF049|nr:MULTISPECIES: Ref family recombination enhancement nuclease [unclassified Pantoea]MDU5473997.1 Ref family recombination enhancement nuclease [Pantoea sp.]DAI70350.1 MAG TPA: Recombination enhancement, RecA-dependent nuclease [Bacteriophage sp.]
MTKAERQHLQRVADLGCIVCRQHFSVFSPAEVHHLRAGCGAGQRASHYRTIPLCPPHHRTGGYGVAIHAGQKMWEKNYGTEESLLAQAYELLKGE